MHTQRRKTALLAMIVAMAAAGSLEALAQSATSANPSFPIPGGGFTTVYPVPALPPTQAVEPNGSVVEDIVARVNDQVITRTEYERAQEGLAQEAKQENWTEAEYNQKQHDLLRDMIDQQILLSKGKELGITGDAETIRQLDDIRKRANLPDMEALQKAAEQQGVSFEDFKQNIRNQAITQQVVRDEVGKRINMTQGEEQAYYKAHLKDFEQPEQVHLSEILIPTPENATDAQLAEAKSKADAAEAKLKAGTAFADLAKTVSSGPTAASGGDLGDFTRGKLGDVLESATFPLPVGGYTAPIRTRQGYVILRVDSHTAAGPQPLSQVENQVQEAIYMGQLQPALRTYLTQAREDAYVKLAPGFVDAGSPHGDSNLAFTTYTPPPLKKKVVKHQEEEQEKAERAEQQLAETRAKLAARQAARSGGRGATTASGSRKPAKIRREKVRFGQAPRNALPASSLDAVAVPSLGTSAADTDQALGRAPGAVMGAPTESTTTISTGTGVESEASNPLEQQAQPDHKTRFASRQPETSEKSEEKRLAEAEEKVQKRPAPPTDPVQSADEKVRAAPLGLTQTPTKRVKEKRAKGAPKERLQDKVTTPAPTQTVAPTVNPTLGTNATDTAAPAATSNQTTLPPATTTPNNPAAPGQPIPSVTSASPNAPNTTAQPPQ